MPILILETKIKSTLEICFDLSCSVDLHLLSTVKTNEKAIAGVTSGLVKLNDYITWEATHFGIRQQLTSKITAYNRPNNFEDKQIKGAFKYFTHTHSFKQIDAYVIMTDAFDFSSPYGIVGKLFDKLILTNYLKQFLLERNQLIKEFAENSQWKQLLNFTTS